MEATTVVELNEMLLQVAAGSRTAFERYYQSTVDRCLALATSVLGSGLWAEDCVAETYVSVWRTAPTFDPNRSSALSWLLLICRNRAIDRLRRERFQVPLSPTDDSSTSEPVGEVRFGDFIAIDRLRAGLLQLSAAQRRVIDLGYFQGLSQAEIANHTGWPLGTVKSHMRRSLNLLRQSLGDAEGQRHVG